MKTNRTAYIVRNMQWGYLAKITNMILPFIFRTVMIQKLGAEYLGINSLFTSVLQVLSLSELGFGSAMVYSMYKPIADIDISKINTLLNYYKKIYMAIGFVIMGVGILIMPIIPRLISGTYPSEINIYFVYFLFLLNTAASYFLFAYRGSLLNAYQRNDLESKSSIICSFFRYGIEILVICFTRDYYYYLYVGLAATVLNNIIKYIYTIKYFPQIKCKGEITLEEKKSIKKNVEALFCHKIGGIVLNSSDNIVLSAFMGIVAVAKYTNYFYIMSSVENIVIICFSGMTASIGNSFVTDTVEKNKDNFYKILFFNAWIVCVCCACFMCLYQDFIKLWLGQDFLLGNSIVILITVYFFVHCIRRTIITFRDAAGMWQDNKMQPIFSALFNLIVNIVLVIKIGLAGILISSILSMLIIDVPWEANVFCKAININRSSYFRLLIRYFAVTCGICGIIYVCTSFICFGLITNLIVKAIVSILMSNLLFYIIFRNSQESAFFIKLIKKYLNRTGDRI